MGGNAAYGQNLAGKRGIEAAKKSLQNLWTEKKIDTKYGPAVVRKPAKEVMKSDAVPVTELTPELSEKLFKQITQRIHDEKVSKEHVLHHLKQLKAQISKRHKSQTYKVLDKFTIDVCLEAIDKKITKINGK